jgi:LysM repeat protein
MKPSFLSTKRQNTRQHPVTRTLRAVTSGRKKQRVAATADPSDFEDERESGSRVARVLIIIFLIHVVAIGLIFVHHYYLKNTLPSTATTSTTSAPTREASSPRLSTGESTYIVARGDNYPRIAAAHELAEADLRAANDNIEIRPGLILRIPPKRIVAVEAPEVAALRTPTLTTTPATDGLVAAIDPAHRDSVLVQPNIPRATPVAEANTDGRTHTVQSGETIWRISQQYNVAQDALLKLNNITDPTRIRVGQKLKIP